jgi:hypothetical protein
LLPERDNRTVGAHALLPYVWKRAFGLVSLDG